MHYSERAIIIGGLAGAVVTSLLIPIVPTWPATLAMAAASLAVIVVLAVLTSNAEPDAGKAKME